MRNLEKFLLAAILSLSAAGPVLATNGPFISGNPGSVSCDTNYHRDTDANFDGMRASLGANGINPGSAQIELYNGCFRVFANVDGHNVTEYFDPETLKRIG